MGQITSTNLLLSGAGLFQLTSATNDTDNLAADIDGTFDYFDADDVTLAELSCDGITINGLNVTVDATITTNNGDLNQDATAPIVVGGLTTLDVGTGTICLVGADGDADGDNDNDLNTLVIVNAADAEIVDRNDLIVNSANVANRLQLQAGNVDPGNLNLAGNLTVGNQILLQASNGVSQTGGIITTGELLLGGDTAIESTGVYELSNNNAINQLAFSIVGTLNFSNVGDFEVTSLAYVSACDPAEDETIDDSSATDKIRLTVDGTLGLDANVSSETVFIEATNGVTQTGGQVISTNLMLAGSGLFQLTSVSNDTDNLAADIDGTLNYFDADDLTLAELSCDGIVVTGLNVTVDATVTTNNGDLDQDATAPIVVGGLTTLDVGTGTVGLVDGDLDADGNNDNDLNTLVIVNATDAEIVDRNDLIVDSANVANRLQLQAGSIDPGNLNLAGNLTVGNQILLQASNGVLQTGGIITTDELLLGGDTPIESSGVYDLTSENIVDRLAFNILGTLDFNNAGDFEVASLAYVSASDPVEDETIADSSATDKARLTVDGTIGLDTSVSSETVFIEATNGVTQTGGQIISTNLMLSGAGLFQLTSETNDTDNLAADINGTFDYFDADDVTLAELSCDGITIKGLNVTVDATVTTNSGDLDQDATAAIVVGGLTTLDVGTGTICLVGADRDADGDNDNDLNTLVIVSATNAEIVDRDDLIVNSVDVVDRLQLQAGSIDPGNLNLAGNLNAGNQILLQASNGVSQTDGIITTSELLLGGDTAIESTGVYDLVNDNVINRLAFSVIGTFNFNYVGDFEVTSLAYVSACDPVQDETIAASSATDKVRLTVDGTLELDASVSSETVFIEATNGVTQTSGQIISTNLLLSGAGLFQLTSETNDTDNLAADVDGTFVYFDADDVTLAELSCDGITIKGLTVTVDATVTTNNGDLDQDATAAIVVGGLTTLDVGTGTICLVGADGDADGDNDNDLNTLVIANATDAEIVDRNDLIVNSVNVADRLQLQAGSVDLGNLNLAGNLTVGNQILLQASNGVSQTGGIVTTSELSLGGDTAIESTGVYDLINDNVVDQLAFSIVGTLNFSNVGDFEVTSLAYVSACDPAEDETIDDSSATDKIRLTVDGTLGLDTGVSSETVFVEAANGVTQTGGQIVSTNLMLSGTGLFQLTSETNDADNLAADIDGTFDYFDADDVTLAELSCDGITIKGLNVTVDATITTNSGDLDQDATAAIVVGGLTTLDVGTGTICLVGADGDADGDNDNDLNTLVIVNATDAEIVDRNDLIVNSANAAIDCNCKLEVLTPAT